MYSEIRFLIGESEMDSRLVTEKHSQLFLNLLSRQHQVDGFQTAGIIEGQRVLITWRVERRMSNQMHTEVMMLNYEALNEEEFVDVILDMPEGMEKPHPESEAFFFTRPIGECRCIKCKLPPETKAMVNALQIHDIAGFRYFNLPWSVHLNMVIGWCKSFISLLPKESHLAVISAAWLQDTMRGAVYFTYDSIALGYGSETADIVLALQPLKGKTFADQEGAAYYDQLCAVPFAAFIKLAKIIANIHYSLYDNNGAVIRESIERYRDLKKLAMRPDNWYYAQPMLQQIEDMLNENGFTV